MVNPKPNDNAPKDLHVLFIPAPNHSYVSEEDDARALKIMNRQKRCKTDRRVKAPSQEECMFLDDYRRRKAIDLIRQAQVQIEAADFDDDIDQAMHARDKLKNVMMFDRALDGGLDPDTKNQAFKELLELIKLHHKDRWQGLIEQDYFEELSCDAYKMLQELTKSDFEYFKRFNDVQDTLDEGCVNVIEAYANIDDAKSYIFNRSIYPKDAIKAEQYSHALNYMRDQQSPLLDEVIKQMGKRAVESLSICEKKEYCGTSYNSNARGLLSPKDGYLVLRDAFKDAAADYKKEVDFLKTIDKEHPSYQAAHDVLRGIAAQHEVLQQNYVEHLKSVALSNEELINSLKP